MTRNYKKSKRRKWSQQSIKERIDKVLSKESGHRKAALEYTVSLTTLEHYVNKITLGEEVNVGLPLGTMKSVFSQKVKQEHTQYVKFEWKNDILATILPI